MSTPVTHPADDWALVEGRLHWAGPGEAPPYPEPLPHAPRAAELRRQRLEELADQAAEATTTEPKRRTTRAPEAPITEDGEA